MWYNLLYGEIMNQLLTIFLTIIILLGAIVVFYVLLYNNIQAHKIKINEAESVIDELLRKKYDELLSIKKIILDNTDVDKKSFDDLDGLKKEKLSSFDFERRLTVINKLIEQIYSDYNKLGDNEDFSCAYEDIFKLNERLEATKSYYNRYTSLLNKTIKKFPSNIIAKIHHINPQTYFDGKDLYDDDLEDFKI